MLGEGAAKVDSAIAMPSRERGTKSSLDWRSVANPMENHVAWQLRNLDEERDHRAYSPDPATHRKCPHPETPLPLKLKILIPQIWQQERFFLHEYHKLEAVYIDCEVYFEETSIDLSSKQLKERGPSTLDPSKPIVGYLLWRPWPEICKPPFKRELHGELEFPHNILSNALYLYLLPHIGVLQAPPFPLGRFLERSMPDSLKACTSLSICC
ncbi:hypothetical protein VNO77_44145 [Canavalia gladiata]|uniref:Uncharacterized protein n=1 Tax=Canavalia gladiata TaxID=3824 RepID=A0AAN9JZ41_CANGL